jgi:8-oxo-dGTP pyrophosphatase MutT (NUDIX family)
MTIPTRGPFPTDHLRAALGARERQDYAFHELDPQHLPEGGLRHAAVLVPLLDHRGEVSILFTKRRSHLRHHAGQICFPGGRIDADDADSLAAALRETQEEIGLPPAEVEILGRLDETLVLTSGFRLTPWVGRVPYPFPYTPAEDEVEAILVIPLDELRLPGAHRTERVVAYGVEHEVHFFDTKGEIIWGATARVLTHLVALWERR